MSQENYQWLFHMNIHQMSSPRFQVWVEERDDMPGVSNYYRASFFAKPTPGYDFARFMRMNYRTLKRAKKQSEKLLEQLEELFKEEEQHE